MLSIPEQNPTPEQFRGWDFNPRMFWCSGDYSTPLMIRVSECNAFICSLALSSEKKFCVYGHSFVIILSTRREPKSVSSTMISYGSFSNNALICIKTTPYLIRYKPKIFSGILNPKWTWVLLHFIPYIHFGSNPLKYLGFTNPTHKKYSPALIFAIYASWSS